VGLGGGGLQEQKRSFGLHKMHRVPWSIEGLLASQKDLLCRVNIFTEIGFFFTICFSVSSFTLEVMTC
jgi:hypothetical protein